MSDRSAPVIYIVHRKCPLKDIRKINNIGVCEQENLFLHMQLLSHTSSGRQKHKGRKKKQIKHQDINALHIFTLDNTLMLSNDNWGKANSWCPEVLIPIIACSFLRESWILSIINKWSLKSGNVIILLSAYTLWLCIVYPGLLPKFTMHLNFTHPKIVSLNILIFNIWGDSKLTLMIVSL